MAALKITRVTAIPILSQSVRSHRHRCRPGRSASPISIAATAALIRSVEPLLVGADASDIHPLWHKLFTALFKAGPGGVVAYAISGIDIALN